MGQLGLKKARSRPKVYYVVIKGIFSYKPGTLWGLWSVGKFIARQSSLVVLNCWLIESDMSDINLSYLNKILARTAAPFIPDAWHVSSTRLDTGNMMFEFEKFERQSLTTIVTEY